MLSYLNRKAALIVSLQRFPQLFGCYFGASKISIPSVIDCISRIVSPLCLTEEGNPFLALVTIGCSSEPADPEEVYRAPARSQGRNTHSHTLSDRVDQTKQISGKTDSRMPMLICVYTSVFP